MDVTTMRIRKRLDRYVDLLREIDNLRERLELLEAQRHAAPSPALSGMPHGGDGSNKMDRDLERKEKLREKLQDLIEAEGEEYPLLERMVEKLEKPDERTVIQMRYFERWNAEAIVWVLYGRKEDYNENFERYRRSMFRIHKRALQALEKQLGG